MLVADGGVLVTARCLKQTSIGLVIDDTPRLFDQAFNRWREMFRVARRRFAEAQSALMRARRRDGRHGAPQAGRSAAPTQFAAADKHQPRGRAIFIRIVIWPAKVSYLGIISRRYPCAPGSHTTMANLFRATLLALRELAPNNILYHEGAKWEAVSFQAPPGGLEERRRLRRLCRTCGAFCEDIARSVF